jgi:hypothetical protein
MIVTIICRCGEPNAVPDQELETALCERCSAFLLRLRSAGGTPAAVAAEPRRAASSATAQPVLVAP